MAISVRLNLQCDYYHWPAVRPLSATRTYFGLFAGRAPVIAAANCQLVTKQNKWNSIFHSHKRAILFIILFALPCLDVSFGLRSRPEPRARHSFWHSSSSPQQRSPPVNWILLHCHFAHCSHAKWSTIVNGISMLNTKWISAAGKGVLCASAFLLPMSQLALVTGPTREHCHCDHSN